jgi:hypothetical protein
MNLNYLTARIRQDIDEHLVVSGKNALMKAMHRNDGAI